MKVRRSSSGDSCKTAINARSIIIPLDEARFYFDSIVKLLVQASDRSDMMLSQLAEIRNTIAKPQSNYLDEDFQISPFQRLDSSVLKNFEAIQAAHTLHEDCLAKHKALSGELTLPKCDNSQSQYQEPGLIDRPMYVHKRERTEVEKDIGHGSDIDHVSTLIEKSLQASKLLIDCIKKQVQTLLWDSPFRMKPRTVEMGGNRTRWFNFRMSNYQVFDGAIQTSPAVSSNSKQVAPYHTNTIWK